MVTIVGGIIIGIMVALIMFLLWVKEPINCWEFKKFIGYTHELVPPREVVDAQKRVDDEQERRRELMTNTYVIRCPKCAEHSFILASHLPPNIPMYH